MGLRIKESDIPRKRVNNWTWITCDKAFPGRRACIEEPDYSWEQKKYVETRGGESMDNVLGKNKRLNEFSTVMGLPQAAGSGEQKPVLRQTVDFAPTVARDGDVNNNILVIDDDDQVLTVIRSLLERHGFNVIDANNGLKGIYKFTQRPRGIDLVILDRNMPLMDGAEVSRRLKEINRSVPILLSSGEGMDTLKRCCCDLGLEGYLCKPFRAKKLVEQVKKEITRSK